MRSILGVLLSAALSGCFINGNGQAQGEARDNGNGNGSENGNGNGNGNGDGDGDGEVNLDGAWDITASGGGLANPSELVIDGGEASGFISLSSEGRPEPAKPKCTRSKDRQEFQLSAKGNALTGTFSLVRAWTGTSCPAAQKRTMIVAGVRTQPGKAAFDGVWSISGTGSDELEATINISAASRTLTAFSSRQDLSFAARKR